MNRKQTADNTPGNWAIYAGPQILIVKNSVCTWRYNAFTGIARLQRGK